MQNRTRVLARAGGATVVALLVAEAAVRAWDAVAYGAPVWSPYTSQAELVVVDPTGAHGIPGAQYRKWRMNALGMRGPDARSRSAPGVVRVVTLGGSETFGNYEAFGREFPRQLEESLRRATARRCPDERVAGVEVLNAAVPGLSLAAMAVVLPARVAALRPDVVVVYPSPEYYLYDRAPHPERGSEPAAAPGARGALAPRLRPVARAAFKAVLPRAVLTRFHQRSIRRALDEHPPEWRFGAVPHERVAAFEADLRRVVGLARRAGARPVLVTHASPFAARDGGLLPGMAASPALLAWERFAPRAPGPVIVAFDSATRAATRRVAADSGAAMVEGQAAVGAGNAGAFADFVHFTDGGAARLASALVAPVLRTRPPNCERPRAPARSGR